MKINHTYKNGFIDYCQVCNSKKIDLVFDLGHQPLADDLRDENKKDEKAIFYPIKIYFCKKCILLQNNCIVGDYKLYGKNYHYRPGISKTVVENQYNLASNLKNKYKLTSDDLIVDVGSNDGTLLNQFKILNCKNLVGIEPTNTIKFQKKLKINSVQKFFNIKTANYVSKKYDKAKLIVTTNVFAHSNNMSEFITGLKKLISKDGIFVVENHYLLDVIKKNQFDTFYHEHLRTYSLKSLINLMSYYGFKIIDAYTSERYGGNIQAHFVLKNNLRKKSRNVNNILLKEKKFKLNKLETYKKFKNKIDHHGKILNQFLEKNKNKNIVAKAFPARAAVIIHYYSFLKKYVKYIAEQKTSLKLNKYVAGTNLKIISSTQMQKQKPDIVIILAWHLFDPIYTKWIKKGLKKTKFIKPLPNLLIK